MTYRNIALMGKARAGKDSVANRLYVNGNFTRVAFADPLKAMALELNPIITAAPGTGAYGFIPWRLRDVLRQHGWDGAKKRFPEVRRVIQNVGQSMREEYPDHWLNIALSKADAAEYWNLPVIVTDCRYRNEADALKARGFLMVRVERPGHGSGLTGQAQRHGSETELDDYQADLILINGGSMFDLETEADKLIMPR